MEHKIFVNKCTIQKYVDKQKYFCSLEHSLLVLDLSCLALPPRFVTNGVTGASTPPMLHHHAVAVTYYKEISTLL